MSNERKQTMPPHCGNCIFHEWDEDRSTCMHPCKVRRDDLADEVAGLADDGAMTADAIAESLLRDAIADQEWQEYDAVCDHWRGREHKRYPERQQEEKQVMQQVRDEFVRLIESMLPNSVDMTKSAGAT